jgi:hypothetical protein
VVITSRYYESSGEILWQVALQTHAFRWFHEDLEEVVLVCSEARAVLRADAADFLFNGCQLEVSARTAVSSAKVAMVVVGEVGRSAVYMRYKNGPR